MVTSLPRKCPPPYTPHPITCMNDVVVYMRLRMHLGLMKTVNYEIMVSRKEYEQSPTPAIPPPSATRDVFQNTVEQFHG